MDRDDVYTGNASLAGMPGSSLPGGCAEAEGKPLPVGVQLIGQACDEARLLRIARIFERGTDHWAKRPDLTT